MIHVHSTTGQQYAYGIVGQGRSFYIYVYRPEQEVYASTMRNVSMAAFAYMVVLFLLQLLRGKTARRYREQQLRREQEYQETLKAAALKAESANLAKTEFLQRMSHFVDRTALRKNARKKSILREDILFVIENRAS